MPSSRRKAFEKAAARNWAPALFEEVFLPPRSPFKSNERAIVDLLLPLGIVRVFYQSRGPSKNRVEMQILVSDLRPTGRVLTWKGPHRVLVTKKEAKQLEVAANGR